MATNGRLATHNRRLARRRRSGAESGKKEISLFAKLAIGMAVLGAIALIAVGGTGLYVYESYANDLVAPDELAINRPSYGAKIYDRNGVLLYEYVDDKSGLRRPVPLEGISQSFLAATIATEDSNFYTNPGINYGGLMRAAWENLPFSGGGTGEGSGGSSITQQLVKNVYIPAEARQERWSREGMDRKIREMVYAIELTERYSKSQILEWYVNQIGYGGVYNGVEAAAQGYFGKPASELTLAEAATLAGIPQSPLLYDPAVYPEASAQRRNEVLDLMLRKGTIQIGEDTFFEVDPAAIEAAKLEPPVQISEKRFPIEAPHFVLQYIQPQLEALFGEDALYTEGFEVVTTLDMGMQIEATNILENYITMFEDLSGSRNGSSVVIDPKTGEILVFVGSRDYFREDIEGKNNNITSENSPGSAFKPFVYLTAFQSLGWGPGTMILDSPVSIPQADGSTFTPRNPSGNFQGLISIRNALGNSLNIPPIKTAQAVGVGAIVTQARKMGFTTLTGGYGPAIATGGVDLTQLDMAVGYSVLANLGILRGQDATGLHRPGERTIDPISILKVTDAEGRVRWDVDEHRREERVATAEASYMVASILTDSSAQCLTFTCGGISVRGGSVGVKTGTSEPYASDGPNAGKIGETWAFGYSPDFVVGIWAGNSDNSPVDHIYSTSISFRAMRDTMITVYGDKPTTPFSRPAGVVEATVCVPSGMKPSPLCGKTTTDLFAKDKVPEEEDTWWQRVRIDVRNGLLASPTTPPNLVEEKVMLVPPPDLIKTPEDKQRMQELAASLGTMLAPTELSNATGTNINTDIPALIVSPSAGSNVSANVSIIGRASSDKFKSYKVEYGAGASPGSWITISESSARVENGPLAVWNTTPLPPGVYTIRLTVEDESRGALTSTVVVNVGSSNLQQLQPPNVVQPTPTATPQQQP